MACRHVVGLQWVRPLTVESIPPKAKGHTAPQREGLAYEAKVRKALPHALAGMWFEFSDANGYGRCQPDFLLCKPSGVQIVETKLTYTLAAWEQLFFLYKPVVEVLAAERGGRGAGLQEPCRRGGGYTGGGGFGLRNALGALAGGHWRAAAQSTASTLAGWPHRPRPSGILYFRYCIERPPQWQNCQPKVVRNSLRVNSRGLTEAILSRTKPTPAMPRLGPRRHRTLEGFRRARRPKSMPKRIRCSERARKEK